MFKTQMKLVIIQIIISLKTFDYSIGIPILLPYYFLNYYDSTPKK
ncbi:hypothetical protein SPPR111872_01450 [Sphingobacterium prati]